MERGVDEALSERGTDEPGGRARKREEEGRIIRFVIVVAWRQAPE